MPIRENEDQQRERKYYLGVTTASCSYKRCQWTEVPRDVAEAMNYFGLDDQLSIKIEPYFYFMFELGIREQQWIDRTYKPPVVFSEFHEKLSKFSRKVKIPRLVITTNYSPQEPKLVELFHLIQGAKKLERDEGDFNDYTKHLGSTQNE